MTQQERLARIKRALSLNDLDQALRMVQSLTTETPEASGFWLLLGGIYIRRREYVEALGAFGKTLELKPEDARGHNNLGIAYKGLGRYKEALLCFKKAAALSPDWADIYYNLGNLHKSQDHLQEAEKYFRMALEKCSDFPVAANNLGILLEMQGRYAEAEKILRRGLSGGRTQPTLLYNMGIIQQRQGRMGDARQSFEETVKKRPLWTEGLNNLGIAQLRTGLEAEAERTLRQAVGTQPENPQMGNNLAYALIKLGKSEEAKRLLKKILEGHPGYHKATLNLGRLYLKTNQPQKAEELLEGQAGDVSPHPECRGLWIQSLLAAGKEKQGKEELKRFVEEFPHDSEAFSILGILRMHEGQWKEAERAFRTALKLNPENFEIRIPLSESLAKQGCISEAEFELHQYLAQAPQSIEGLLQKGDLLLQQGKADKALSLYLELEREQPQENRVLRGIMRSYRLQGDREKAVLYTEKLAHSTKEVTNPSHINLDNLRSTLEEKDRFTQEMAEEFAEEWSRNIDTVFARKDEDMVEWNWGEEEDMQNLFANLPDIAGEEVPIVVVGGIEPVITINEEEELVVIDEEGEELPPLFSDKESLEKPEVEAEPPASVSGTEAPSEDPAEPPSENSKEIPSEDETLSEGEAQPEGKSRFKEEASAEEVGLPKAVKNLFDYLRSLFDFLPNAERERFEESGMADRIEKLRDKFYDRAPGKGGLLARNLAPSPAPPVRVTEEKVAGTLGFIRDMAETSSDFDLKRNITKRIDRILDGMQQRGESGR